jgi:hypothetical protein
MPSQAGDRMMTGKSKNSSDGTGDLSQPQQQSQDFASEDQADTFGNIEPDSSQFGNIEPE